MKIKKIDFVGNVVIGMSDGLTVPFALLAGLASAVHNPIVIIIAGISEIAAGAVSMGLGGYLSSKTEDEFEGSDHTDQSDQDALASALTIGLAYIFGGLFPLAPYLIFINHPMTAQVVSIVFTLIVLFGFGVFKAYFTKHSLFKSGLQTLIVGGLACAVAYLAAYLAQFI